MATKMTKKDYFNAILSVLNNVSDTEDVTALTAFINHEIELIENKRSSAKPTKTQTENIAILDIICNHLAESGKPMTISEMQKAFPDLAEYSCQKLSAILNHSDRIVKTTEKKKSYFSVSA